MINMSETNFEKLTGKLDPVIKCPSCGAEIDINMNFCPYCGYVNEYAQENSYMDRLEEIEEDLGEMSDYAEDSYKKEFGSTIKRVIRPILIIVAIIFLIIVLFNIVGSFKEKSDIRKTISWQNENFPKLNEMYEAGDFDAMQLYINDILSKPNFMRTEIYNWEHFPFASAYDHYYSLKQMEIEAKERPDYLNTMKDFVFNDALELCYGNYDSMLRNRQITERDYEYIKEYQEYAREYMQRHFGITDLDEIALQCSLEPPAIGFDLSKIRGIMDNYEWVD